MTNKLNIYQKINKIKLELLNSNLKKSGKNKFANFEYFELADFVPTIIKQCNELNLFTKFNFYEKKMVLEIIDIETKETLTYETYFNDLATIKGANVIQNLGGTQTYLRRYLLLMAFDIVEPDAFDAISGKNNNNNINNNNNNNTDDLFNSLKKELTDAETRQECIEIKKKYNQVKIEELEQWKKNELNEIVNNKLL